MTRSAFAFLAGAALACSVLSASGQATLISGNSTATIDLVNGGGMNSWRINGVNQLSQQWFWLGVGTAAQRPINTLGTLSYSQSAGNLLEATYSANTYNIRISYMLDGGLAGGNDWTSDISETISIQNTSTSAQTFRFFQYSDFNLLGDGSADSVNISLFPSVPPTFWRALQTASATQLSETVDSPFANHAEAAFAGATLTALNGGYYTLNDNLTEGPGDVTWAFQWDFTLNPGESIDVLKDKRLSVAPIPEPASLALLSLGFLALVFRRQHRA